VLQKCTDVLERVSGLCAETCLTASDVKLEEDSDMPEEEDPLAVTSPAVKAEQEVSNVYMRCECWDSNGACWGIVQCCVLVSCLSEVDSLTVF